MTTAATALAGLNLAGDYPDEEKFVITGSTTTNTVVAVHPAELLSAAFDTMAWLKYLGLYFTDDGRNLPVTVFNKIATDGGGSDTLLWGDEIDATAQGAEITDADPSFSSATFAAHKRSWRTSVSNETIRDVRGFEDMLKYRAGYGLGLTLASVATTGPVSATDGLGFVTSLSGGTRAVSAAAGTGLTHADMWKLYSKVESGYRTSPSTGFVAHDTTINEIAEASRGSGPLMDTDPMWRERYGAEGGLYGKPVWQAPGMPEWGAGTKGVVGFGAWECYGMRIVLDGKRWEGEASPHKEFDKDRTQFRFAAEYDCLVLDQFGLAVLNTP